jgi:hypothetical protein
MKPKFIIFAFCIPILAIVAHLYLRDSQEPARKKDNAQISSINERVRPVDPEPRKITDDIEVRLEQARKDAANRMTNKDYRSISEGAFNHRKPELVRLFEKWKIDEQTASTALEIIKQRFLDEAEANAAFFKNYENKNRFEEMKLSKLTQNELAGLQLSKLLGENRYRELSELEAKIERETTMRLHKNMSD